jgi:hypoxanthine phosphoribosyltransferase
MRSYDYIHRQGVRALSWDDCAALAARLAEALAPLRPDLILGVARAGLIPATTVSCALRRELYPIRLTRRVDDEVRFATPVWRVPVPDAVAGRTVAVVDEIADTGQTLALVARRALDLGAARVVTACLVAHSWAAPMPDVVALRSDELLIFPWDRRVLIDGRWQMHPELVEALAAQGLHDLPETAPSDLPESEGQDLPESD